MSQPAKISRNYGLTPICVSCRLAESGNCCCWCVNQHARLSPATPIAMLTLSLTLRRSRLPPGAVLLATRAFYRAGRGYRGLGAMSSYARAELLVTADELRSAVDDGAAREGKLRIVDCNARELFLTNHLPTAVHIGPNPTLKSARNNRVVVSPQEFEELTEELGLGEDSTVVLYDSTHGSLMAARAWLTLRYHGHERVRLLEGGFHGWVQKRLPALSGAVVQRQADKPALSRVQPHLLASASDILAVINSADDDSRARPQLLDVRTEGEFAGEDFRGNSRGGRIPGTVNLDFMQLMHEHRPGFFRPADELEEIVNVRRRGVAPSERSAPSHAHTCLLAQRAGLRRDRPVITVCQAGVRAATAAFALKLIGFDDVRVYDASSEWRVLGPAAALELTDAWSVQWASGSTTRLCRSSMRRGRAKMKSRNKPGGKFTNLGKRRASRYIHNNHSFGCPTSRRGSRKVCVAPGCCSLVALGTS